MQVCKVVHMVLDLTHGRSTTDAGTRATTAAAHAQAGEDGGGSKCGEAEPQEGSRCLRLVAAFGRAGGDFV